MMKVSEGIPWEVILIDNASTDNTSEAALNLFKKYKQTIQYKILRQPVKGLSYARKMGIDNSQYEYIIFCDDDNMLNDDYVELSYRAMEDHPSAGAIGGESEAVIEGTKPEWFNKFEQNYSVGKQSEQTGDISMSPVSLWGAGMVIRKTALNELFSNGFKSLLTDRRGSKLTSGGDSELCYALRLAGWRIYYLPQLKLKHFISKERLEWSYLRKLNRGFGAQKVDFDPYLNALGRERQDQNHTWQSEAYRLLKKIRGYGFRKLIRFKKSFEGDSEILNIEKSIGRLTEILKIRSKYDERITSVKNAKWRKINLKVIF